MSKHILIPCQYFYPEQFRINDIAFEWVKRGYKVTVVTGIPNYPEGKFFPGYSWFKKRKETVNGVEIIRIPIIPRGHTKLGLIANYFSYPIAGFFWNLFTKIKADAVFMFETSPMNQLKVGVSYGKKHHVPVYAYIQDLWPENVQSVGHIDSPIIIRPIERMVEKIYRGCTHIFTTSPSFVEAIRSHLPAEEHAKVHFWPQYAEEFYQPKEKEVHDDFRLIFTGNIGKAQGLEILPEVAARYKQAHQLAGQVEKQAEQSQKTEAGLAQQAHQLADQNENLAEQAGPTEQSADKVQNPADQSNLKFVIVGDGRAKNELEAAIKNFGVEDMFEFTGRKPANQIPELLATADAAFISFTNDEIFAMTIPAKLQSYMACGMPILASAIGETQRIVTEAECGYCSMIGDANALLENIEAMIALKSQDLQKLVSMGENAVNYNKEHFLKKALMDEMDQYLLKP